MCEYMFFSHNKSVGSGSGFTVQWPRVLICELCFRESQIIDPRVQGLKLSGFSDSVSVTMSATRYYDSLMLQTPWVTKAQPEYHLPWSLSHMVKYPLTLTDYNPIRLSLKDTATWSCYSLSPSLHLMPFAFINQVCFCNFLQPMAFDFD